MLIGHEWCPVSVCCVCVFSMWSCVFCMLYVRFGIMLFCFVVCVCPTQADDFVKATASGKLQVIVDQIKFLQLQVGHV